MVDIQSATRKLCHRQMTWFRNRPEFRWLDATQDTDLLLRQICDHVQGNPSAATGELNYNRVHRLSFYIGQRYTRDSPGYGSAPMRLFFSDSQLWSPQALQIKSMGS